MHFYNKVPLTLPTTITTTITFFATLFLIGSRTAYNSPNQGTRSNYQRIRLVEGKDVYSILLGYWLHPRSYNSS